MTPDEDRKPARTITLPVVVDIGMIIALATLSFWVGRQADRIDNVTATVAAMQASITVIGQNDSRADIAALKERTASEDRQIADLKDTIIRRIDRLELKLDGDRFGGDRVK